MKIESNYFLIANTEEWTSKKNLTEWKAKVVAAVWGTYLNSALTFSSKDDLKNSFWKNIHFGRVVV